MALNINDTLEELIAAIELAVECCEAGGSRGGQDVDDPELGSSDVEIGEGGQFQTQEQYNAAKCLAANAIFDQVKGQVDWLQLNGADLLAGGFGGITAGILVHFLAGPLGWAALAVEVVVGTLVGYLIAYNVNFSDLQQNMDNVKDDAIQALYNAGSASAAETAFIAVLAAGSPGITSVETGLVGIMLTNKMLNELFNPSPETLNYNPPDPATCTSALQTWTFAASGQGWTFEDQSTPPASASGVWDSATEAWKLTMDPDGDTSWGAIYLDSLSIAVDVGNSVQADYSAPSDGNNSSVNLRVTYSDASEDLKIVGNTKTAGTITLDITASKTIAEIEARFGRQPWPSSYDQSVLEVRVQ